MIDTGWVRSVQLADIKDDVIEDILLRKHYSHDLFDFYKLDIYYQNPSGLSKPFIIDIEDGLRGPVSIRSIDINNDELNDIVYSNLNYVSVILERILILSTMFSGHLLLFIYNIYNLEFYRIKFH